MATSIGITGPGITVGLKDLSTLREKEGGGEGKKITKKGQKKKAQILEQGQFIGDFHDKHLISLQIQELVTC